MDRKVYEFSGVIEPVPEKNGVPYDGSVVNMGVKNSDGSICYIIGIRKEIRERIGKEPGDMVAVMIQEREAL